MIIIFGVTFLLCLPTYNSNFKFFEIKPLVPLSSILRDSPVFPQCIILSDDVASRSEITPCNKIDKRIVYRLWGNRYFHDNTILTFLQQI